MKKNSQIHLMLETPFKEALKKEAEEQNMCVAELCRSKLKKDPNFIRVEKLLIEIKESLK